MSPKIGYKRDEKVLSIRFSKVKSVDSDIKGNVVIDYDGKGNVVGIDIMQINLDDFMPLKEMKPLSIAIAR